MPRFLRDRGQAPDDTAVTWVLNKRHLAVAGPPDGSGTWRRMQRPEQIAAVFMWRTERRDSKG